MTASVSLSESLEDYLKAIFDVLKTTDVVRAKNLSAILNVNNSSVTAGLKRLKSYGLINYNPYEYITLTDEGEKVARSIAHRHKIIKEFLIRVLSVDAGSADEVAHKMEHSLPTEISERFVQFINFFEGCPSMNIEWHEKRGFYCETDPKSNPACSSCKNSKENKLEDVIVLEKTLAEVRTGEKVVVKNIRGKGEIFKKIIDMGVLPGTELKVVKIAPLGDPMEILVKGYHLTLRKEETRQIVVV